MARLDNISSGSVISLTAKADCELWLDLKREDTGARIFASTLPKTWNTVIRIPEGGTHLLYFHNRDNRECGFKGQLHVKLDRGPASAQLQRLSEELQKVFVMEPIDYQLVECDTANSYAVGSAVQLCRQHLEALQADAADRQVTEHLILFTLMHETGHVLLTQWQYPFNNNEDVVDEFAVVLTRLMNREAAVETQAKYFAERPSISEYEHIVAHGGRHSLSVQRARNLREWLEDPQLLRRWMPVLVPHLQSDLLRRLQSTPDTEMSALIQRELRARSGA